MELDIDNRAYGRRCLLCMSPMIKFKGEFRAAGDEQHLLHSPPGRVRTIWYWLCAACWKHPNCMKAVKKRIFDLMLVMTN